MKHLCIFPNAQRAKKFPFAVGSRQRRQRRTIIGKTITAQKASINFPLKTILWKINHKFHLLFSIKEGELNLPRRGNQIKTVPASSSRSRTQKSFTEMPSKQQKRSNLGRTTRDETPKKKKKRAKNWPNFAS